ncbi:MAG: Ig-like domain-containing protein [Candidatus Saccharimonas sp.]
MLSIGSLSVVMPFVGMQTATALSSSVYKGIPVPASATYPSLGYAATSTKELGDLVQLGGTDRLLNNVTVNFTSWACQSGAWNTDDCTSAAGATFTHPVTVNLYNVGPSGSVGSLIATTTSTITAKYRPSTDNINCIDDAANSKIGQWYDTASGTCYSGTAFDQTFNFSAQHAVLPDQVIVGVAFNTSSNGYAPIGVAGPYDALNVSLPTSAPTVGSDVNPDIMYWNTTYAGFYTDGGAAGVGTFRADTGWSGSHLGVDIHTDATPTLVACPSTTPMWYSSLSGWNTSDTRTQGSNTVTGDGLIVQTWGAATPSPDQRKAAAYLPVDYALTHVGTQTIAQSIDWTQTSGTNVPGLQLVVDFDGNGTADGILVGEAIYGNDWWLPDTGSSALFVKNNAPNVGGGFGSSYHGTLNDWLSKFPVAQVKAIGYSLGSGVNAEGIIKSITLGCNVYKFDNVAPLAPVHVSPANGALQNTNDFWFDWSDVSGAVSYEMQNSTNPAVDSNGSFQQVMWTGDYQQIQPIESQARSVGASGTWYWQVRAVDAAGNKSAWTTPWAISLDVMAPSAPTLNSPSDNAVVKGASLTQSWNASSSSDVDHYVYESYNDAAATSLRWSQTVNGLSKTATNVASSTFWWRVKAVDNAGNVSAWSPLWKLTIDNDAPGAPITTSSKPYYTNANTASKTLTWVPGTNSTDVAYYEYAEYYNTAPANQSTPENWLKTPISGTSTTDTAWGSNITIYWRVRAVDFAGNKSLWSDTGKIITDVDAPVVTVDTIASGEDTTPTITGTTSELGGDVTITLDGAIQGTTTSNASGNWSWTPTTPLAVGSHMVLATATDAAGNVSMGTTTTDQAYWKQFAVSAPVVVTPVTPTTPAPQAATVPLDTTTDAQQVQTVATTDDAAVLGEQDTTKATASDTTSDQAVEGTSDKKDSEWTLLGFAWYWWLLVIAVLMALWWAIAAWRNRNSESNT